MLSYLIIPLSVVLAVSVLMIWKHVQSKSLSAGETAKLPLYFFPMLMILAIGPVVGGVYVRDAVRNAKYERIQSHGARSEAQVTSIYNFACSRHGPCILGVKYGYVVPAIDGSSLRHYAGDDILLKNEANDPRLIHVNQTGEVPIAYDLQDPSASAVNFDDTVFAEDHAGKFSQKWFGHGISIVVALGLFTIPMLTASLIARRKALPVA